MRWDQGTDGSALNLSRLSSSAAASFTIHKDGVDIYAESNVDGIDDFHGDVVSTAIQYAIDALTIAIWVPILMTLSIRELSNSSTTRVLIPTLIIGVLVAIVYYFLRPTLLG